MNLANLFRKRNKTLIVADEGAGLRGIVVDGAAIGTDNRFAADTALKTILDFGKKQGADSVLFLRASDVREIEVRLGPGLDAEERHSAIEYAAASNLGDHSGNQRVSYLDGTLHDFRSGILISHFDAGEILDAAKTVREAKMKFLGITNFKQLLMAAHFSDSDHHGNAFLFLLENHGFVAIPERRRLAVRNLPFGVPDKAGKEEWEQKIERRLFALKCKSISLYSPEATPELSGEIRRIIEAESVEIENWEEALNTAAVFYFNGGKKLIHPALPPPKPKDPRAPGTVIGLAMFGATLLAMAFLMVRNVCVAGVLKKEIARNEEIAARVKREKSALEKLQKELTSEQELFQIMKRKRRVSKNYLLIVNLLERYPLQYTRITSIEERAGGVYLEGESVWQPDLSKFLAHFQSELNKYRLTLFSDGLSKKKDGGIIFRSHISAGGK